MGHDWEIIAANNYQEQGFGLDCPNMTYAGLEVSTNKNAKVQPSYPWEGVEHPSLMEKPKDFLGLIGDSG